MRALFVCEGAAWSGGARAFAAAARGLAARGWAVQYACTEAGPIHARVAHAGIEVVPLPARAAWFRASSRLRDVVRRGVDVVFVHGEKEAIDAATAVWRASRGAVVRRLAAGATLTVSQSTRAAIRMAPTVVLATTPEQTTLPAELSGLPTIVADVGIDVDRVLAAIEPEPAPPDDEAGVEHEPDVRRLVCVCDADSRSRAFVVLRAVAMLAPRHRELRLVLVGPGADDEEIRLHSAALGIHRFVRSAHTRDEDVAHRRTAHVGWVTAEGDDGAFGALDFMASSVPVLVDRGSIGARYVADAITGAHITPGDVPDTAATLATLLAREETRQAMGNAGRARVARTFGEAGMIDGFARAAAATQQRAATPRVAPR